MGSFPPLPSPAAAATVAAVRRELEAGRPVVTASPRPSAASLVLRVTGPLGAWRLEQERRRSAATTLVLSLEPGWPLPPATFVVLGHFARVSLLVSDDSPAVRSRLRRLRHVVDEVVFSGHAAQPEQVAAVALAVPRLALRVLDSPPLGKTTAAATPLGPPEPASPRSPHAVMAAGVGFLRRVAGRAVREANRARNQSAGVF